MAEPNPDRGISRREMFARLFKPVRAGVRAIAPAAAAAPGEVRQPPLPPIPAPVADGSMMAVIAGRHCLAYQGSFCTTCSERCPVPGALVVEGGLPRVVPELCTGCRVCHDVCPAPELAIRILPRPAGLPRPTACAPAQSPFAPPPGGAPSHG